MNSAFSAMASQVDLESSMLDFDSKYGRASCLRCGFVGGVASFYLWYGVVGWTLTAEVNASCDIFRENSRKVITPTRYLP